MPSPKDKFAVEFFEFDFFQAVRLLEKFYPARAPIGRDADPADEIARFRAHVSMAFPPSQIVALEPPDDDRPNPLLTVTFFGLYGPSGVLPSRSVPTLLGLCFLAATLFVAMGVLDLIRGRILVRIGASLDESLSTRVYETIVQLPLKAGNRSDG